MIWKNINFLKLNYLTIIKGWYYKLVKKNLNIISYDVLQQAIVRKSFCDNCPLNTNGWCDSSKEAEDIHGEIVVGCGCELEAKQLTPESFCPRLLWTEMLSEQDWNNYIIKVNNYYITNYKENYVTNEEDINLINILLNGTENNDKQLS